MILDIVVICLVLISGFIGFKKGFIVIVIKLVGFILAILLAFTFYKALATYLYENYDFAKKIENSVHQAISSKEATSDEEEYINLSNVIKKFNLSGKINLAEEENNVSETKTLSDVVAEKITSYIMNIIAFLIIFVGVVLIAAILSVILSMIFQLPLLKSANKLGGFVIEIVLFVIKLWVILEIITILSPMSFMSWIVEQIDKSIIVRFLYNNNLLASLLYKIKI